MRASIWSHTIHHLQRRSLAQQRGPARADYRLASAVHTHPTIGGGQNPGIPQSSQRADQQAASFRAQIAVARDMLLPIIVHSRDADEDMAMILEEEMHRGAFYGVMHCFSSGATLAKQALAMGLYISFSGILTFNKSADLQTIAAEIPLDRILVETDSPYLAPTPHRGKSNEPAFTVHILTRLAEIRGLSVAEMAAVTRQNTARLFGKMRFS